MNKNRKIVVFVMLALVAVSVVLIADGDKVLVVCDYVFNYCAENFGL